MKSKYTVSFIIIAVVVGVGLFGYSKYTTYAPNEYVVETSTGTSTMNATTGETTAGVKSFTALEVATHKDATSCYSIVSGSVYDLTAWVNVHPGGKSKILSMCGVDGTAGFMGMHKGGQKFMDILARFKIGTLS